MIPELSIETLNIIQRNVGLSIAEIRELSPEKFREYLKLRKSKDLPKHPALQRFKNFFSL
jgi:hypothetical protein